MDELVVNTYDQRLTGTSNTLSSDGNGSWNLNLDDGTIIPLEQRRAKELYVIFRLTEKLAERDREFDISEDFPATLDEYILTRFDCFKLVARALVDFPLGTAMDANTTAYFKLCKSESFHEYESFAALETELYSSLSVGQLVVGQIIGEGEDALVQHTMLLVRGESGLYILHKSGNQGPAVFSRFDKNLFVAMKLAYGKRMAFVNFDNMVDNPQLKTYFENPLPRAR